MSVYAMGIPAAAAHLGVSRKVIDHAITHEQLPARRVGPKGGRWSVTVTDLHNWYDALGHEARDDEPA